MADTTEIDALMVRIEVALEAAHWAVMQAKAKPDHGPALEAAETDLAVAKTRVAELEGDLGARDDALSEAIDGAKAAEKRADAAEERAKAAEARADELEERLAAAEAAPRAAASAAETGASETGLASELEAMREARALDLAEIEAILTEIEPLLADAQRERA